MSLFEAVQQATDTSDGFQYIARVKAAVHDYLVTLDATAKFSDTTYFNHSAIPDFVARWPNERGERHVYLRSSYTSIWAAEDERFITSGDPIILALDNSEPAPEASSGLLQEDREAQGQGEADDEQDEVRQLAAGLAESGNSNRMLVTDVRAIDVVNTGGEGAESPLQALVRANFIRGARGLVDAPVARNLVAGGGTRELIVRSFFDDAAVRINRTAQLIALADSDTFPPVDPGTGEPMRLEGGQLSAAELGAVLPWLLRHRAGVATPEFWQYLASLTSLQALEGVRAALQGIDLTPLVIGGANRWAAKRAAVGLAVDPLDGDAAGSRRQFWSFESGPLGIDVGDQRLSVAVNGQQIKDRPGSPTPAWEQVRAAVDTARLSQVSLRGIARRVAVGAEGSDDISADVDQLTSSLTDRYFVDEVGLRFPKAGEAEGTAEVTAHFDRGVVTGTQDAALADVARTALRLLNFRDTAGAAAAADLLR